MSTWGDIMDDTPHSWLEVMEPEEFVGGPSPTGNSYYSVFEQCPYKFDVAFNQRMKLIQPWEPLEIGGLFHECRARYYNKYLELAETDIGDKDLDLECEKVMFDLIDRVEKVVPQIAGETRRILRGWLTTHGPERPTDDRHETLLVEVLIETDRGWPYSGRLDRVIWSEELAGPVIMEIKTASKRSEEMLAGYTMDPQFLGQQYLWRYSKYYKKYGPLKAFVVDLAVKTAELRFPRHTVPIINSAIRDWERQRRHTYRDMILCAAAGYWPRHRSNCVQYVKRCGLTPHCAVLGKGAVPFPGYRKKETDEY